MYLKDYKSAYDSFEKAAAIDPKNKWFLHGMYDVCYQTQDFNQAIVIVEKLTKIDAGYKEPFTSLEDGVTDYVTNYLLKSAYY